MGMLLGGLFVVILGLGAMFISILVCLYRMG